METNVLEIDGAIDKVQRVDAAKALEYRLKKHMSYAEIGKLMGVTKQAVQQRLERFSKLLDDPEIIDVHDNNTDKILTGAMHRMICNAVDDEKIKSASTLQLVTSYGILFDKQRLNRGLATSITQNVDLTPEDRETLRLLEARIIEHEDCTVHDTALQLNNDNKEIELDTTSAG
jgi:predicted transcriptional regulator